MDGGRSESWEAYEARARAARAAWLAKEENKRDPELRRALEVACRADREGRSASARWHGWLASRSEVPAELLEQLAQLEEQDARRRDELIDLRVAEEIWPIIAKQEVAEERLRQHDNRHDEHDAKQATTEQRLAVLECLKDWIDRFRTRIEAVCEKVRGKAGRRAIKTQQVIQRLREEGVTRDGVLRCGFAHFARRYGVDRRTVRNAARDL